MVREGGQRDPHAGPRGLIISHGGRCLQPETQPARSAAKVPRAPPEPPIAGSQPRAQSPPTGNIPGPPLPGSLPPSLLPPQPGLRSAATSCRVLGNRAHSGGPPESGCSQRAEAGTAGRPAVGGSGRRPLRLPRATFKFEPASPRHLGSPARLALREPARRPRLGECPQVCPSPFARAHLAE